MITIADGENNSSVFLITFISDKPQQQLVLVANFKSGLESKRSQKLNFLVPRQF